MSTVDWDTKTLTETILDTDLPDSVVVEQKSEGETGGSKLRPHSSSDIVRIEEPESRSFERADILYETFDKSSTVYVTISTRDTIDNLFSLVLESLLNNRRNPGGNWDRIEIEDLSVSDPKYQKFQSVIQVTFIADSQTYTEVNQ
jgi:hypothetical protein